MKLKTMMTTWLVCLLTVSSAAVYAELELAIVAPRGGVKTMERWGDLANYLSVEVGETVNILPLTAPQIMKRAENGEVDLVLSHSAHTVAMLEQLDGTPLATVNTAVGPRFGGVIVARKSSGIVEARDLVGKNVLSLKFKAAAGGYIFQTYELSKQNINPHKDFASITEGKRQDRLILAVRDGKADAAFVRTGLLETMDREGEINLDDFTVVNRQQVGDFPLLLSTELYAEWCMTVMPHVDPHAIRALTNALMRITPDMPAAQAANITGFVEPVSLENIETALKKLKISPFDN